MLKTLKTACGDLETLWVSGLAKVHGVGRRRDSPLVGRLVRLAPQCGLLDRGGSLPVVDTTGQADRRLRLLAGGDCGLGVAGIPKCDALRLGAVLCTHIPAA